MPSKPNELGPIAIRVANNVRRLRIEKGLSYARLAQRLAEVGHPLAITSIKRIEAARLVRDCPDTVTRRIDVDDLCALAAALDTKPDSLLFTYHPSV